MQDIDQFDRVDPAGETPIFISGKHKRLRARRASLDQGRFVMMTDHLFPTDARLGGGKSRR
jgi:hypothetical protein